MFDITLWRDESGWSFRPHSAKADNFLFGQFAYVIGERDLTAADVAMICQKAASRGFRVDDKRAQVTPYCRHGLKAPA